VAEIKICTRVFRQNQYPNFDYEGQSKFAKKNRDLHLTVYGALDIIQKHNNTLTTTENEVQLIKSSQENRIQEIRNLNIDLKQKLDFEIEQRKLNESSIISKMSELFSKVDGEKSKSVNLKRDFEIFKKETNTRLDDEYKQISSTFSNTKEIILSNSSEKIEKAKDDIQHKLIEMQKSAMAESQKFEKFKQNFHVDLDSKIEKLKVFFLEELNHHVNELKNNFTKLNDIVNKLNEGITLIELQNDERNRRYEKVLNAEINSRKSKNAEYNEKLHNYNEKLSVTVQSLQASFEKLTTKVDTTRNQFVDRNEFFSIEKRIDDVKAEIFQNNLKSSSLKETIGQLETNSNNQALKIKDLNDQLSQIENSKMVLINNRIEKLPSKEDFINLKIENEQKLEKEIQRIIKQNDIQYSDIKKSTDDRYDQMSSLLNSSNNRFQQKINMNEKLIKDQISLQNEYQQKYLNMFKDETKALIISNEENKKDEFAYIEEKLKNSIDVNEKFYESRIKTKNLFN
ncbi:early endosome antigen 1-like isoform X21, partial [Brachionus plicatilis]